MRLARSLARWFDWRSGVVATVFLMTATVAYLVYSAEDRARDALRAQELQAEVAQDIRAAQSRRIDRLEDNLRELARQGAERQAVIDALVAQLRQLGVEPLVTARASVVRDVDDRVPPSAVRSSPSRATPRPTPAPPPEPTPAPDPEPSPEPPPEPSPVPEALALLCNLGLCIQPAR